MKKYKILGLSLSLICVLSILCYQISILSISTSSIFLDHKPKTVHDDLTGQVELTVRLSLGPKNIVNWMMCCLFRSASLFWDPKYGSFLLILDKEDAANPLIDKLTSSNLLPFNIRFAYEDPPVNVKGFQGVIRSHNYGYYRMLYSSFLMDLYTNASIIAWTDTDTLFTTPVIDQLIMRNGKLIVHGYNTFAMGWVRDWDTTVRRALGLNMVADFMTYFPIYVYPSTIKNCREYIIQRLNVTTFEEAFIKFSDGKLWNSPVNVIISYAYYFERGRYDWHINTLPAALPQYNKEHLPANELLASDTIPEIHHSYHLGYYKLNIDPLERALCFLQIYLGGDVDAHCNSHKSYNKLHLFEFQTDRVQNHWELCKQRVNTSCEAMTGEYYTTLFQLYQTGKKNFTIDYAKRIDEFVQRELNLKCGPTTYTVTDFKPFKHLNETV